MKNSGMIAIFVIIGAILIFFSTYMVDETQQVIVTQFKRIIGEPVTTPGFKWKLPWQHANYFPKNLQEWDADPGQIPTLDKTYIWVDSFARWRIVDPIKFFLAVNNKDSALNRLDDIIDAAIRNLVTSYSLIETVRKSNRELDISTQSVFEDLRREKLKRIAKIEMGREKIAQAVMQQAAPKVAKLGIELVDVKFKRINYIENVRKTVYDRMIAERRQMAEKFRSEGQGEAEKIIGDKECDLKQITSEAYRRAQEIKGRADATATKIFAHAYQLDPEFYSFTKTLDIYKEALNEKSSLILSTDSEFFKYFKNYQ